jgi:hypothetical protein
MKNSKIFVVMTLVGLTLTLMQSCSKSGCTDSKALNFNSKAKKDDGTCVFSDAKSQVITISDWTGGGAGYTGSATVPIITQSILNSGAVLCYIETTPGVYWAVPYSEVQSGWTRHWAFAYDNDEILIQTQDDDDATPNPGSRNFKIVVIESSGLILNPNVDLTNYKEVEKAFNL